MPNVIEVENVSKRFNTYENRDTGLFSSFRRKKKVVRALDGVSFSIKRGEIVALLGRNGSGKSTMIKTITGILHPDSGKVSVLGLDPWRDRQKIAMDIGVVFGATHPQLYWNLPPIDTFEYVRDVYGVSQKDYNERLKFFIELLDISKVYKKQTRQLSLGERMKCEMVAALLHFPKFVVMDEPTIGVDLPARMGIKKAVRELRKRYGMTFLITTHVVDDISMADRIVMLEKGKKIFDGKPDRLKSTFSRYIILEVRFIDGESGKGFETRGRVISSEPGHVKLGILPSMLKEEWLRKLITSDKVADYRISEPGLSSILARFYSSRDHRSKSADVDADE